MDKSHISFITGFILSFTLVLSLITPIFSRYRPIEVEEQKAEQLDLEVLGGDNDTPQPYIVEHFIPPGGSFGLEETNFTRVNWSFFWSKFTANSAWNMQGWHPGQEDWVNEYQGVDLDEYLNIGRERSADNSSEKITLNFTSPYTTKYRFTFGIDARVLQYVNKTDQFEYVLTYPINGTDLNYTVYFNWSDLIPMLENDAIRVNHGIQNIDGRDVFWFRIITNIDLQEGQSYELDPTFGYSYTDQYISFTTAGNSYALGHFASPASNGYITSLTFKVYTWIDTGHDVYGALYAYDDFGSDFAGELLGVTEAVTITGNQQTKTIDFTEADIRVYAGTNYYLFLTTDFTSYNNNYLYCKYDIGYDCGVGVSGINGDSFEDHDPITGETDINRKFYLYANYDEASFNDGPTISNPNPTNGSYNESISTVYNVTIVDNDADTMNVSFYISTDNSTWTHLQKNASVPNGSFSVDLTGQLTYDTFYYLKVTANDSTENTTFYSTFETTPYRTTFFNTSFPTTSWVQSSLNMSYETSYYNATFLGSVENVFLDDFVGTDGNTLSDAGNWSDGGGDYEWIYDDDDTPSTATGASATALATTPGTDYLFTEASSRFDKHYYLDSDTFTGTNNITVDFYYHMYGSTMGTLSVQIWDGASWDTIWTKSGQEQTAKTDAFTHAYAYSENGDSHPYTGTTKIRFDGHTGANYNSDMCITYVTINRTTNPTVGDAYLITKNITKQGTVWDKFYADVNNTDNSTFSFIDPTNDDHTIISGLVGNGDDISSVTNSTIRVKGDFNATLSLDSINLTWSVSGIIWQSVSSNINGTYTNDSDPAQISSVYPSNGSSDIPINPQFHIDASDNESDTMDIYWYWKNTTTGQSHTNWITRGRNMTRTSYVPDSECDFAPINNTLLWTSNLILDDWDEYGGQCIHDGIIYQVTKNDTNKTYALYLNNGTEKWSTVTGKSDDVPYYYDGKIFLQTTRYEAEADSLICLWASNGTEVWNFTEHDSDYGGSPAIDEENQLVITTTGGMFYAVHIGNGTQAWNYSIYPADEGFVSDATYYNSSTLGGVVVSTSYKNGSFCLYSNNGTLIWHNDSTIFDSWDSNPIITEIEGKEVLLTNSYPGLMSYEHITCSYLSNGTVIWDWRGAQNKGCLGQSYYDETIYVGGVNHTLYAINCTLDDISDDAREKWIWKGDGDIFAAPPISNGYIYFTTMENANLYCLNITDGTEEWNYSLSEVETSYANPGIGDGILVVSCDDGYVRAFGDLSQYNKTLDTVTWELFGTNLSVNDGTYYQTNGNNFSSLSTEYEWKVCIHDGSFWTNETYNFTTTDGAWNTVINTINGTYSNSTSWNSIITTINGTYSNESTWKTIIDTVNGSYSNGTDWKTIIDTINGSYSNSTDWKTIINTINGTYTNLTNSAPIFTGQYPSDGAIDIPLTPPDFNITIEDPDGDNMNYSYCLIIEGCGQGGSSAMSVTNGTHTIILNTGACCPLDYSTTYTWWVNLTDDYTYTNETFSFTTIEMPWNTVIDTINGSYSNSTAFKTIIDTINGTYSNTTIFKTIIDTINGSYSNTTIWSTIIDTINGSYSNTSTVSWKNVINTINGSYSNSTVFKTIIDTINGTYSNNTDWSTIDNTINGSYSNTTIFKTIIDTINGTYSNTTIWTTIDDTINGTYSNTTTSLWNTVINTINGTYSNTTIWATVNDTINGTYSNTTHWSTVNDTINGTYSNLTSWSSFDSSTNGTFSNTTLWIVVNSTINGSYSNTTSQPIFSNENPSNNSNNRPITLTWNITIYDNTGNFNWTINCSNGQNSSANNAGNGSKTLSLSLNYSTTYTIWVNATNGNGIWTREIFYFTTTSAEVSGNFDYHVEGHTITVNPTLGEGVDFYKWKIENSINGETTWINSSEIDDYYFSVNWDDEYLVTLFFKNETIYKHISKLIGVGRDPNVSYDEFGNIIPDEVPIQEEEPDGKFKNIFEDFRINTTQSILILLLVISLILLVLISKRRKKEVYVARRRKTYDRRKKK